MLKSLIFGLLFTFIFSVAQGFNVFLDDSRKPMLSSDYPWSAIGRLIISDNDKFYACTGTLVAKDLVLTAAHCFVEKGVKADSVYFLPHFKKGRKTERIDVASVTFDHRYLNTSGLPREAFDYAFAKLAKDADPKDGVVPVTMMTNEAIVAFGKSLGQPPITIVGYSGDFDDANTAGVQSCHIRSSEMNDQIMFHDCSVTGGSSGGPILIQSPVFEKGWAIVGVSVAEILGPDHRGYIDVKYSRATANIGVNAAVFAQTWASLAGVAIPQGPVVAGGEATGGHSQIGAAASSVEIFVVRGCSAEYGRAADLCKESADAFIKQYPAPESKNLVSYKAGLLLTSCQAANDQNLGWLSLSWTIQRNLCFSRATRADGDLNRVYEQCSKMGFVKKGLACYSEKLNEIQKGSL